MGDGFSCTVERPQSKAVSLPLGAGLPPHSIWRVCQRVFVGESKRFARWKWLCPWKKHGGLLALARSRRPLLPPSLTLRRDKSAAVETMADREASAFVPPGAGGSVA